MIGEGKRQGVYTLFDMYFANEDGNRADEWYFVPPPTEKMISEMENVSSWRRISIPFMYWYCTVIEPGNKDTEQGNNTETTEFLSLHKWSGVVSSCTWRHWLCCAIFLELQIYEEAWSVKCRMVAESSKNMGSVMPLMVLHIMGEDSEVWDSNNNHECNRSDEDFRIFFDLLKFYNALPFCLVFVTSIFRCKWNISS
jgi:hypothetical protein